MKHDDALLNEVADLVFLAMDGGISDEQLAGLEKLLLENPKARDYYFDLIYTCIGLNESEGILSLGGVPGFHSHTWKKLADYENQAEPAEIETPAKTPEIVRVVPVEKIPHPVSKLALYTAIVSAAAMLVVMAYVYFNPRGFSRDVATMTDSLNAQWSQPFKAVAAGTRLFSNERPMELQSGLVKIAFDEGIDVVIEGPAKYRIADSFVIAMEYGRLYAHVAASGRGFTVETANARIVDLGTEFGVQTGSDGGTELHVFAGETTLISGAPNSTRLKQFVYAGNARLISQTGESVKDIALRPTAFARHIDSGSGFVWRGETSLDLADIVAGGNGLGTGAPNAGLSVFTGNPVYTDDNLAFVQGPDGYRPVPRMPLIDGVFIPKTANQTVSSQGHLFSACPTTEGFTWGGVIATGIGFKSGIPGIVNHYYVLDGTTYGRGEHACINMHSNIGITFDLDAIRGQAPDLNIKMFTAVCGLSKTFYEYEKFNPHALPKAEFFVAVDGKLCFASGETSPESQGHAIDVALDPTARFLTLIVTQGSDDPAFDWGLFAEPKLHLERDRRDSVQVRQ